MGFTIAEKILGFHSIGKPVEAGQLVVANADFAMIHDARTPGALAAAERFGPVEMPFARKCAMVVDHYSPPPSVKAANIHVAMREFSEQHGLIFYDVGFGICHQLLPENGHLTCGDLITGTDTHSTTYGAFNAFGTGVEGTDVVAFMVSGKCWFKVPETIRVELDGQMAPGVWAKDVTLYMLGKFGAEGCSYRAIEYKGTGIDAMDIDDRMTLCNHAAELGAKAALLEADEKTIAWLDNHGAPAPKPVQADPDARYVEEITIDSHGLEPLVARRHEIDDVVAVKTIKDQPVHLALIGTCTNGRMDDIRQVAAILKGKKVAKGVRLMVTPASRQIYLEAEKEGLLRIIAESGGSVASAGCGPCLGISQKFIPGRGEVVISSANRNFKGRLGNPESEIWIASAATVAASAITGRITDPRKVEGGVWRQT